MMDGNEERPGWLNFQRLPDWCPKVAENYYAGGQVTSSARGGDWHIVRRQRLRIRMVACKGAGSDGTT